MAANSDEVRQSAIAELARRELERRQQQQPEQRPRTRTEEVMRQLGLTGRAIAEGVVDAASPFADALSAGANLGLSAAGSDFRFPQSSSQHFSETLTQAGVPEPEGGIEKVANFGGRVLTGGRVTGSALSRAGLGPVSSQAQQKAPSLESLKSSAQSAYKSAEQAGVTVNPQSFNAAISGIKGELTKRGFNAALHPRAAAALKEIESATGPQSFQQLEILRRVAKNAAAAQTPDERRIAMILVDKIDDFVRNLGPSDVLSGDRAAAQASIREARSLWSRLSKGEVIEELIERAGNRASQFSGSGYENALRTEFRNLAQNAKRMRMFTAQEREAIQRVAKGGPIGNAMRMVGKFAPRGVVSTTLAGGAGYAAGGPMGSAALLGMGEAGRRGATALTSRNARLASELMRRGAPTNTLVQPEAIGNYLVPAAEAGNALLR